jgi:uncharacterized membrane protein
MTASNLFQAFLKHRARARTTTSIGAQILFWGIIPVTAVGLGVTLLVKAAVLAVTFGDGFPMKVLHANQEVPGIFAIHILTGTIALLIGPWQLSAFLRGLYPRLHRGLGRSYVGFVLFSAGASLFLAPRLDTLGTGYLRILSAVLWLTFTVLGVVAIRNFDIAQHRRWMMRSYAFTFMGLTLLLYNWIGDQLGIVLAYKYPAVSWLTFLTNVLFVETVLWRSSIRTSVLASQHVRSDQTIEDRSVVPARA